MKRTKSKNALSIIYAHKHGYRVVRNSVISPSGKQLKILIRNGYSAFNIRFNGKTRCIKCHRMVAYQEFGDAIFEKGTCVRHIDEDKTNFSVDNIAIGTQSDNIMDIKESVRVERAIKAGRENSTLTDEDVINIRKMFKNGHTLKSVCEKYGIAKSTASYIKNRITYKYL